MAVQIRGSQVMPGTIAADRFIAGLSLATSQLADGANFLKKDGSVALTGSLNLGSQKIINLLDPTALQDAATKNYVDTSVTSLGNSVFKKDGSVTATGNFSLGGYKITNVADPTSASDVATKNYVDLVVQGLSPKTAVRAATTANISLTGTQTIDGVALSAGDRILVKNQTTASTNGIYVVASGAWTRATDADTSAEIKGAFTFVQEGTTMADTGWVVSTDGAITLGTTSIAWVQFSSAGQVSAGDGLTKNGSVLSVLTPASSGLTVSSGGVQVALDGTTLSKTATGLKVSDLGAGKVLLGNFSGAATPTAISGDITIDSSGVATVVNVVKSANMVYGETPAGTVNGANATFTLSGSPVVNTEQVFYNGSRLVRGAGEDYTISGTTITMISYIPQTGDKLVVDYIKS